MAVTPTGSASAKAPLLDRAPRILVGKGPDMQEPPTDQHMIEPQEPIAPYRRSPFRAGGSIVLWIVAAFAFLLAALSAAIAAVTGSFLGSVAFYVFVGIGFVFFGLALWRRKDPRPRRLNGRVLTIAGAASLVAALVSTSVLGTGDSKPIFFAGQRYEAGGGIASVLAPGTDGWQSQREKTSFQDTVNFARDVGSGNSAEDSETLRAHLSVTDAPGNALPPTELIAQALDTEKRSNATPRMRDLEFNASAVASSAPCARYDWTAKDTGAARFPGTVFQLTAHGLMCTDSSATHLVNIGWSHRYLEGTEPKIAESSAEPFLSSLKVTDSATTNASPQPSARVAGGVLFSDTFKDTSGRWRALDNEFARMGYLPNGSFGVELRRFAHAHVSTGNVPLARDVEVEVAYRVASTAEAFYGPTCRVDDAFGTFYVFGVTSDGRYGIQRNIAGKLKELAWSGGTVRGELVAPASIRIVAQCYGDGPVNLVLSVNGTTLLRLQDSDGAAPKEGRASFFANGEAGPVTRIETFTVRDLSR
jgi:hypothetical protein